MVKQQMTGQRDRVMTQLRIGDLVLRASARGGELPSVDDVDAA